MNTVDQEKIGPSGLTSKRIGELIIATGMSPEPLFSQREMVRRVIDGLITSGELRVVKKASNCNGATGWFSCDKCGATVGRANYDYPPHHSEHSKAFDYCPGCGAQITK